MIQSSNKVLQKLPSTQIIDLIDKIIIHYTTKDKVIGFTAETGEKLSQILLKEC